MNFDSYFNGSWLKQLTDKPEQVFSGRFDDVPFTARIAMPNYGQRLLNYYPSILKGGVAA